MVKVLQSFRDGCGLADQVVGGESSCFECPFGECLLSERTAASDDFKLTADYLLSMGYLSSLRIRDDVKVRPLLKTGDLRFIRGVFMVYAEEKLSLGRVYDMVDVVKMSKLWKRMLRRVK